MMILCQIDLTDDNRYRKGEATENNETMLF